MTCSPSEFAEILLISVWLFLLVSSICLTFVWFTLSNKSELQPTINYCGLGGALGFILSMLLCMMSNTLYTKFWSQNHIDISIHSESSSDNFEQTNNHPSDGDEVIVLVSPNSVIPITYDIENHKKDIIQDNIPIPVAYMVV